MDARTVEFARHWWEHREQTLIPRRWLGVPCWQNPFDVWIIQEIIGETRPQTVIETGTLAGGGALLWASLLSLFGDGQVISIDLREEWHGAAVGHPLARERVTFVTGSSIDPAVFDRVASRCSGTSTMVILDSDHSADHVLAELDLWSRLVTPGNYLIVQDGIVTYVDPSLTPGPLEAVQRWIPDHPDFKIDETRERMLFTLCPSGFLLKQPA
jgi:cephalosporin hydroxylase